MTAAEVLRALEDLGVRLLVGPGGRLEAELPDPQPPAVSPLLDKVRTNPTEFRDELARRCGGGVPVQTFEASYPCLACATQLREGVLFCNDDCMQDYRA